MAISAVWLVLSTLAGVIFALFPPLLFSGHSDIRVIIAVKKGVSEFASHWLEVDSSTDKSASCSYSEEVEARANLSFINRKALARACPARL